MILITGCARSGTSLTTGILAACGARLGDVNGLNENTAVRDGLVKPYLVSIGADPRCQHPLPDIRKVKLDPAWRAKVIDALGPGVDCYKGAKMCLIWPLWTHAFPDAKWVIVRRDKQRIVDSCLRTPFMNGLAERADWERWVDQHLERFGELKEKADCIEVWPDMNPVTFRPVVEFCGLKWDAYAAARLIDPKQWHG